VTAALSYSSQLLVLCGAKFAPVCAKHRGAPVEPKEDAMRITRNKDQLNADLLAFLKT
jgi:hypothetical protein